MASFDDLAALAGWGEDVQEERWSDINCQLPEMAREMLDGTRLIAQPMVGGPFMAWIQLGCEPAQALLDEWENAWTDVFAAQLAHLPRPEWLKVVQMAGLKNAPMVPNVTVMQYDMIVAAVLSAANVLQLIDQLVAV